MIDIRQGQTVGRQRARRHKANRYVGRLIDWY